MEATIRISSSFATPSLSSPSPSSFRARLNSANGFSFFRRRPLLRLRASSAPDPCQYVEVIGIGSRKDALIDFCLGHTSLSSSSFRFWTIHWGDSQKAQLLQKCHETGVVIGNVEFAQLLHQCSPAVILVASTGHGLDHIAAIELLNTVKSAGGLAAAILLKPFSFEGQRRQEEVDALVNKLQGSSQLYFAVEANSLQRTEAETLAEALESANNAVFLAINSVSKLMTDLHMKILSSPDGQMKEVKSFEVLNLLEAYGEAKVCSGSGYNLKSAIVQAMSCRNLLGGDLRDLNGLVVFTVTSSCAMDRRDMSSAIHNFRRFTGCTREIIISHIYEPAMEPNLIVTTLLIVGCYVERDSKKKSFLSGLAVHLPFLYFLLGRDHTDSSTNSLCNSSVHPVSSLGSESMSSLHLSDNALQTNPEEVGTDTSSRESSLVIESSENFHSSDNHHTSEGVDREQHSNWNIGPGFHIAQLWAKERANFSGIKVDILEFVTLPAGVKLPELSSDSFPYSESSIPESFNAISSDSQVLKGRNEDDGQKRGLLSARAALMLESERESPKSWSPVIELQYRGGTYKGHSQGGLPDGKGRLTFRDGSFYDGMWRYGKRSGPGTFCYSNGDVFQGAWRDDLMHGRGWFYFHTGDRWFANFWKGKANGEGRFYSKSGSIFFGCFKNGWRHGEGQHVDIDGSRWIEIWNEGALVSRACMGKGYERADQ
ncbi:protein ACCUMULATION AND REPLICATION OF CHLOROPLASTS 3 isoform X1 [Iris pallida]|uniref:Protein ACCUMULATION AND REPLICATION OF CHLOROPLASTS 3 isoform X1 n=1 Tax=Iris pallida TaxID=29817 RepID=A0AAX6HZL5_IRIPA|nr:protein ACCUMULATION AND REPLICATION OF CHLOROPLASTS 3 isoform X1 [Iris pallida]